jgi:hypothetical protein
MHIELAKTPPLRHSNRKHKMNSSKFDNWVECSIIINTVSLFESFDHQPCFIAINGAISFTLDLVNLFAINKITATTGGTRCQVLFLIRAEYSESIAAFQFGSANAACTSAGSSVIKRLPYRMVPSVKIVGFWMPNCNRVRGAATGTGPKVDAGGTCVAGSADKGAESGGWEIGAVLGTEYEAGPWSSAGMTEVVAQRGSK